jgi:hypothetical protein
LEDNDKVEVGGKVNFGMPHSWQVLDGGPGWWKAYFSVDYFSLFWVVVKMPLLVTGAL